MSFVRNKTAYQKPHVGQKVGQNFLFIEEIAFSELENIQNKHKKALLRDNCECTHCGTQGNHIFKVLSAEGKELSLVFDDNLTIIMSRLILCKQEGGDRSIENLETSCFSCAKEKDTEKSKKLDPNQNKSRLKTRDKKLKNNQTSKTTISKEQEIKLLMKYKFKPIHVYNMGRFEKYEDRKNMKFFMNKGVTCVSCNAKAEYVIITKANNGFETPRLFTKDMEMLTVDHIIPVSRGGPDTMKNKQTMCYECNQKKSNSIETPKIDKEKESFDILDTTDISYQMLSFKPLYSQLSIF